MSLYAQTSGHGPALLLIHGWSLHGGIWDRLLPLLEPYFQVTRVDLPGHGRSDWQGEATLDAMAEAVLSVAPLVEIASSPCFVRKPDWQSAMLPDLLDTFAAELAEDYVRTLNRFLALQVHGSENSSETLKTLRALMLMHGELNADALRAGLELLRTTDLRDSLGAVECPVLLLAGERDTLVPLGALQASRELFRDARLQVIAGAGHAPFIAQPEQVARMITGFLCEEIAEGC